MKLEHLLSPVKIGTLELRNRVAMAPMGMDRVEADGIIREPTVAYYSERARGGTGLLITENTAATYPRGANSAHEIGVSDEKFLPGLTALANGVHQHGGKIAIQLAHHGKVARLDTIEGRETLMPSMPKPPGPTGPLDLTMDEMMAMAKAAGGGKPRIRVATPDDLEQLAVDFADAVDRARRAGFDAVEIHGAHGYIFSEFLSPAWNFRDDEYGGSVENRSRLLCNVLRAARQRVGADFPIWCRIDAVEFDTPGGIELSGSARTAELLEAAGADAIHVSAYGNPIGAGFTKAPLVHTEAGFVDFAAEIKKHVTVPVLVAGRIPPALGDELIRDGRADVISMGRQLLADPETVNKLAAGRADEVRPCVYCYVCVAQPFFDRPVRCAVNPVAANEEKYAEKLRAKSPTPKKVVVVGGGPAGVEAACIAALRGHEVVLFERSRELGGTLRFAALPYEPNEKLLHWLDARVRKLPVTLRLGEAATPEKVGALSPDVILAAVGAVRERSDIPGADRDHVWDGDQLRDALAGGTAGASAPSVSAFGKLAIGVGRLTGITNDPAKLRKASRLYMPLGKRVAIVGGGLVGAELAEFLAERGREVTVLEEESVVATEMAHPRRWRVLHDLREAKVRLETDVRVVEIGATTVRFEREVEGERGVEEVAADSVILARGLAANPGPVAALASLGVPVTAIGDAKGVGYIEGAIQDGFHAAIDL